MLDYAHQKVLDDLMAQKAALRRISGNGEDTYEHDAFLGYIDAHYRKDSFGSRREISK